jgi:hypothetical protein
MGGSGWRIGKAGSKRCGGIYSVDGRSQISGISCGITEGKGKVSILGKEIFKAARVVGHRDVGFIEADGRYHIATGQVGRRVGEGGDNRRVVYSRDLEVGLSGIANEVEKAERHSGIVAEGFGNGSRVDS